MSLVCFGCTWCIHKEQIQNYRYSKAYACTVGFSCIAVCPFNMYAKALLWVLSPQGELEGLRARCR